MIRKDTRQLSLIKEFFIGFCLGTANIIPGVSGGTFLLVFKIYERVFVILNNINKTNIFYFFSCLIKIIVNPNKADLLKDLIDFLRKNDFVFLFKLIAAAVAAIFCLSSLMKYLLVYHFAVTYSLFFGLILVSIIIPVKMVTSKKFYLILFFLLGAGFTIYVTCAVNPYEKVKTKSESYQGQYLKNAEFQQEKQDIKSFGFKGKYTANEYIYAFICGSISISAMVLPGVSGSLVLILMGEYFEIVSAISGLKSLDIDNFMFLTSFALGIIFGGLLFARFVNLVLKRYYNATMSFLTGLMAGSLYALWPFKKSIVMAQQYIRKDGVISIAHNVRVYTNINEIPQIGPQLYMSLISFMLGCIIMFFFIGKQMEK